MATTEEIAPAGSSPLESQGEPSEAEPGTGWQEDASELFVAYGSYFVPARAEQLATIGALVPPRDGPFQVLELACGEGLLAEALLQRHLHAVVHGLDGSLTMRNQAQQRLARFGQRFSAHPFDLAGTAWRVAQGQYRAVVSSLAIHHLDGAGKQQLFCDLHGMIEPGGSLVIADVVQHATPLATAMAADAWDEAVRQRALALDGTLAAFELFERERWNMYRFFDPNDIDNPSLLRDQLRWLDEAGFESVELYWMQAGHAIFGGGDLQANG